MSEPILEMRGVEKRFGGVRAIDEFSLKVEPGMVYGLIGPNGAGKTTIFNTITGIYHVDAGKILFQGKDRASSGGKTGNRQNFSEYPAVRESVRKE